MEHENPLEVTSRSSNFNYALPFELLGEILSYISDDPLDLRYALLVCRSWYNATVHHANLWVNIILGYKFLTRFLGVRLPHGDAFVRLCLSRSSPLPLHISVHDPDCSNLYERAEAYDALECFFLVKYILVRNSGEPENLFQRCKYLSWFIFKGPAEVHLVSSALTCASLPALEYMTIKNLRIAKDELHVARFPRLPRLKEVRFIDHSEPWGHSFFHDDDFAGAERLTFTITDKWHNNDLICMRRFQSIRTLILQETRRSGEPPWAGLGWPVKEVELPLLEALALSGSVWDDVLTLIEAPGLKRMWIEENTFGRHSLFTIALKFRVRPVEYLYVWLSEDTYVTSKVKELERLVEEARSLISVFVSPWMEQHLREKGWKHATRNLCCFPILDRSKYFL